MIYGLAHLKPHVSSGFYIRQLIHELGIKTGLYGIALDINRIKIHI